MSKIIYDKKEQLKKIESLIVTGEKLYAVYDMRGGGTGFVGITDLRLIFMDQAFVRKQKAVVSLPYTKITAIGAEDSGTTLFGGVRGSSKLTILVSGHSWSFEFRSNDKAHKAYQLIMRNLLQTEAKEM